MADIDNLSEEEQATLRAKARQQAIDSNMAALEVEWYEGVNRETEAFWAQLDAKHVANDELDYQLQE
jgi:hypothetical protein